jgi:hypothetical protein
LPSSSPLLAHRHQIFTRLAIGIDLDHRRGERRWPNWLDWLKSQNAETVPARQIGGGTTRANARRGHLPVLQTILKVPDRRSLPPAMVTQYGGLVTPSK